MRRTLAMMFLSLPLLGAADWDTAFTTEVGPGHQTAQPAPADARVDPRALPTCQHRDPRMSLPPTVSGSVTLMRCHANVKPRECHRVKSFRTSQPESS